MMKVLLTIGLLLAASLAQVSSNAEDGGSGMVELSTSLPKFENFTSPVRVTRPDDTVSESGSGDDDEDAKKEKGVTEISGDGSGGEEPTSMLPFTMKESTLAVTRPSTEKVTVEPTTEMNTTPMVVVTEEESSSPSTKFIEDVVTTERAATTIGNEVPRVVNEGSTNNAIEGKVGTRRKSQQAGPSKKKKEAGLSFTVGIIIGVVIGAILAILIILFLVYRLRKKDEGSYALGDPSTGFIKDEPGSPISGKEYFA